MCVREGRVGRRENEREAESGSAGRREMEEVKVRKRVREFRMFSTSFIVNDVDYTCPPPFNFGMSIFAPTDPSTSPPLSKS